jgi:hypothetical protein
VTPRGAACVVYLCGVSLCFSQTAPDFTKQVRPILQKNCYACHGPALQQSGLRLDAREEAMRGGYSGPAIVKGDSNASRLIQRVTAEKPPERMPPAGPGLKAEEIAVLRAWIDAGAVWPESAKAPPKADARPRSTHWAFQRVERPAPPAVKQSNWPRNPIDNFILARLEKEGVTPSPEAAKTTLLRRVSLDLTGLPPTPYEIEEFLGDTSPDAYERLVDRLLASPHYGERWARQWLDLAHYADSDGYEKDLPRPHAWRWRHWVINALNGDMPFDEFTRLQLAGDLLPGRTVEHHVATGFLRNTLTNREAGVDRDEARFEQIVSRTNTVSTAWLGLTMSCAQCHDHKYDPLSQKDYYSLFAFFNSVDEEDIDAPLPGEVGPYLQALPEWKRKRQALLEEYEVPELLQQWEAKMVEAIDHPGRSPEWDFSLTSMKAMFNNAVRVLKKGPRRSEVEQFRLTNYFIQSPGVAPGLDKEKLARFKELREKLKQLDKSFPALSQAQVMVEDPEAPPTHIHIKGDWRQKGIPVARATPAVLPPLRANGEPTRLDLANWIVSRDNPLTARVWVNRAWQEFFGRGLVRTSEDFGTQGEQPSHPELLDWLAAEFMDSGWRMKHIHRLIVTSATYRQSSHARPELSQRDPENTLLARQSRLRLPAETLRDVALAASGLLDTRIGGRSVYPPQPEGVAQLGYGGNEWPESTGPDRYRRGLYIFFQRTSPYPMLMNFDAPDSNFSCTRRPRSNTPLQSLNLLNDEVFYEAANALAWRVEREAPDNSFTGKLEYAFLLTLGRKPTDAERERLAAYYDQQSQIFAREANGGQPLSAWLGVGRVLLNLDEFIVRE